MSSLAKCQRFFARLHHLVLWAVLGGLLLPVLGPLEARAAVDTGHALPDAGAPITDDWVPPGLRLELQPWLAVSLEDGQEAELISEWVGAGGKGSREPRGMWASQHGPEDAREWRRSWAAAGVGSVLALGVSAGIWAALADMEDGTLTIALSLGTFALLPALAASFFNRAPFLISLRGGVVGAAIMGIGFFGGVFIGAVLVLFESFIWLIGWLARGGERPFVLTRVAGVTFWGMMALGTGVGLVGSSLGPPISFGLWAKKNPRRDSLAQLSLAPLLGVRPGEPQRGLAPEAVGGLQLVLSY